MTVDFRGETIAGNPFVVPLKERAVLRLSGEATFDFLQRLVTCDMRQLAAGRALHGALLTPQGKLLHEFLLVRPDTGPIVLIEADAAGIDDLVRRLMLYRLRTPVEMARADDLAVFACDPASAREIFNIAARAGDAGRVHPLREEMGSGYGFLDPRSHEIGVRLHLPAAAPVAVRGSPGDYAHRRRALAIAEGVVELPPEQYFAMEANLDRLGSISFDKGCYVGQEVTTRTYRRGRVKKRLAAIFYEGRPPARGEAIVADAAPQEKAGMIRIGEVAVPGEDGLGLALVRLAEAERIHHGANIRFSEDGRPVRLISTTDCAERGEGEKA